MIHLKNAFCGSLKIIDKDETIFNGNKMSYNEVLRTMETLMDDENLNQKQREYLVWLINKDFLNTMTSENILIEH